VERVEFGDSKGSFTNKLKTLFWIASTNFVFPLIFSLCQIVILFVKNDILVAASVAMANIYISIISTVFATIWSSTTSFKDAGGIQYSSENKYDTMEPIPVSQSQGPICISIVTYGSLPANFFPYRAG